MLDGEPVAKLSEETGVTEATLFRWKKQAKIDAGQAASADTGVLLLIPGHLDR